MPQIYVSVCKKGNAFAEQDRNGWIYGNFMPRCLTRDNGAEIKITKLNNSFTSEPHYNKTSTKIDIIWSRDAIWEVDGTEISMSTGDYLIVAPQTTVCIRKVLSDELIVQTLRFPSTPDDKVMGNI